MAPPMWPTLTVPERAPAAKVRAHADEQGNDRGHLRIRQLLAYLGQMPAHDVSGLVGEDANDLVGRLRLHQRAGIDEDVVRVHHECVERSFVDDDNVDVLVAKAGDFQNRAHVIAQQLLDFGVADDRNAGVGRRFLRSHRDARERHGNSGQQRHGARNWPRAPRLARRCGSVHFRQCVIPRGTQAMDGTRRGQHNAGAFAAAT